MEGGVTAELPTQEEADPTPSTGTHGFFAGVHIGCAVFLTVIMAAIVFDRGSVFAVFSIALVSIGNFGLAGHRIGKMIDAR